MTFLRGDSYSSSRSSESCQSAPLLLRGELAECAPLDTSKNSKTSSTSSIISEDNFAHQSPIPSLDLISSCSNLSRALSREHAN